MELSAIGEMIQIARDSAPVLTWPGYDIREIPFAIYDDNQVCYIGHPNPPDTRPANLMAATSVDINGIATATIPATMCLDTESALPLAYHEGFHVFQQRHFVPLDADMFLAMAFYPDLDVDYRALCRLEIETLRRVDWSAEQQLRFLGHIASLRRSKLTRHDSLLGYERFLERSEGTAYYVEQKARQALFGVAPILDDVGHGWIRFYVVGAAICRLLEKMIPDWTTRIENGESPGDLVIERGDSSVDLELLDYRAAWSHEAEKLRQFRDQINGDLTKFEQPDVMRIRYQGAGQIFRAFNPSTLVSLGDGRILHRSFFKLLLPGRGTIAVDNAPVMDNVLDGEVLLTAIPIQLREGRMRANTAEVRVEVMGVKKLSEGTYALTDFDPIC